MNLQSLVVVALRLITLNFLLSVAVLSAPPILQSLKFYKHPPYPSELLPFTACMVIVGLFVCAILLWIFALPIARLVTRRIPQDIAFGAMSLVDCYSIAFIGVGLYYIVGYLPKALNQTYYLFKWAASDSGSWWMRQVDASIISQTFIPFIAGILLFVFGRKWALMLARKHAQVPSPVAADNEKHVSEN